MRGVHSPDIEVRNLLRREVLLMQQLFDTLQRELQSLLTQQYSMARSLSEQRAVVVCTCARLRETRVRQMQQLAAAKGVSAQGAATFVLKGTSAQVFGAGTHLAREVALLEAELVSLEGRIDAATLRTESLKSVPREHHC